MHGITREQLQAEGKPGLEVAERTWQALQGAILASDWPEWDASWLQHLLAAFDTTAWLPLTDAARIYAQATEPLYDDLPKPDGPGYRAAYEMAQVRATINIREEMGRNRGKKRHRAAADARQLWATWQAIRERMAQVYDSW